MSTVKQSFGPAARVAVEEQGPDGLFPITTTFRSGWEVEGQVRDFAELGREVKELGSPPVLYRGRSRVQLDD